MSRAPSRPPQRPPSVVRVLYDGNTLSISPERLIVRRGTPVQWKFRTTGQGQSFRPLHRWAVRFDHGVPFRGIDDRIEVSGPALDEIATGPLAPVDPGDFKYAIEVGAVGVAAPDAEEDPWLIVRP